MLAARMLEGALKHAEEDIPAPFFKNLVRMRSMLRVCSETYRIEACLLVWCTGACVRAVCARSGHGLTRCEACPLAGTGRWGIHEVRCFCMPCFILPGHHTNGRALRQWKELASMRVLTMWERFLSMPSARKDAGYGSIKAVVERLQAAARRQAARGQ
mgnify:CR=1 FL=1